MDSKVTHNPDSVTVLVRAFDGNNTADRPDELVTEEPMETRVLVLDEDLPRRHSIAITMRTPGHDHELAAGFLFTEGVVSTPDQIQEVAHGSPHRPNADNVVNVSLTPGTPFDPSRFSRNVYTTSSCGICGKTSLDLVRAAIAAPPQGTAVISPEVLTGLSNKLNASQTVFSRTGGLHAAALFDTKGQLQLVREDVGRHNAVDKVVGSLFMKSKLPASDTLLWVSGRAGFELVQKALMAGIPIMAAVGAPSSLAVEAAQEFGMTLVGFLRDGRFNVYSGGERIASSSQQGDAHP